MKSLFETQKIIIDSFLQEPFYDRHIFKNLNLTNRITGIMGSRGIGKTTLLLHEAIKKGAQNNQALYVSADHLYFLENRLIDLVDQLYKETDVHWIYIDEIHKYPNWKQELKNIFDVYKQIHLIFSGSSMIDIIHSKYDLSRRVSLSKLQGFSFREYLEFTLKINLPRLSFEELINHHVKFSQGLNIPQILKYFQEYIKIGYYPFFREFQYETDKFQAIENIVQKSIYEDIAILHSLKTSTLFVIEQIYKYILNSVPGEMSVYKLANVLKKDFESIGEYLSYLNQAGLVNFLYPLKAGKAFLRNPAKVYPENSNLIYASYVPQLQDSSIGKIRETFALNQLKNAGISVYYSEVGDLKVDNSILEIGGKNKTRKQIKNHENAFIIADGILIGDKQTVPLYLLGFLY